MSTQRKRIPVTVITGFLGSGKTTLLNHILSSKEHGLKFAVIENELGSIGIDNELLQGGQHEFIKDEIIEVMNGCICCTVRTDLIDTLNRLYKKRDQFDNLIIETTGMADPAPVIQTFFIDHMLRKKFTIDCVITVVDAYHILERLREKPSNRDADNGGGTINESMEQIAFADKVLLNKTDLLQGIVNGGEQHVLEIEQEIKKINPTVPIVRTCYGKVNPNELIDQRSFDLDKVLSHEPELLDDIYETHHDGNIGSISISFQEELHNLLFQNWLNILLNGGLNQKQNQNKKRSSSSAREGEEEDVHEEENGNREEDTEDGNDTDVTEKTEEMDDDIDDDDEDKEDKYHHNGHDHHHHVHHHGYPPPPVRKSNPNDMKLFRYKGIFAIKGIPNKYVLQGVGMLYDGNFVNVKWKENEIRESKMVFIGKNLKTDLLQQGFESCKITQELRFDINEQVYVNVDDQQFVLGTVIQHWDRGFAYRVQLMDTENGTSNGRREVRAPLDIDEYIRKK